MVTRSAEDSRRLVVSDGGMTCEESKVRMGPLHSDASLDACSRCEPVLRRPLIMHRRTLAVVLLFAPLALASMGCSRESAPVVKHSDADLKTLTPDEVEARISARDGKTFVFDNNSMDRYAQSHLPGARWLDIKNVTAAVLPADKSATLVFYCASPS
jgi:rhodanese-like protein